MHQDIERVVGIRHHVRRESGVRVFSFEPHLKLIMRKDAVGLYQSPSKSSILSLIDGATIEATLCAPSSFNCSLRMSSAGGYPETKYTSGCPLLLASAIIARKSVVDSSNCLS